MKRTVFKAFLKKIYEKFFFRVPALKLSLYPIEIPEIVVEADLDFLLLELPARYMPLMPNGLAYVHNLLKDSGVKCQTIDVNIIFYHRYHSQKILNKRNKIYMPSGRLMVEDPWDNTSEAEWAKDDFIDYFWPQIEDIIRQIVEQKPKAVGISLNGFNRRLASRFVKKLKEQAVNIVVIAGGYDCVYPYVGPQVFQDYDYMVIGEAEPVIKSLVQAIIRRERPKDLPGVVSKFDSPSREFEAAPLFRDLDSLEFPKYEWVPQFYYQTFDRKHLIPITGSRGCNWSKCRFCAECFPFRKRSPKNVVDEMEYWTKFSMHTFHFNESDVNGDHQNLFEICSEIIKRELKVRLVGQLRIDKRNTKEYFEHLHKAGFTHLRFGVDGWSTNTLKLQCKGYTMESVYQNLKDCHDSGIFTAVNIVIGVPGETDDDVEESISHMTNLRSYIDLVESMNTLILAAGSEYFRNSDKYKIRFREKKESLLRQHPTSIPEALWFSEDPYIDQKVRVERLNKICKKLHKNGVAIGSFASKVVEKIRKKAS
ncbi:MAG: hypothetical protein A3G33_05275 [Omnitrophica bacterium RIFCSPLOWO2_12_FULL_44_17]|uniref:B12-binding domain-containing protein n=1 Tax=Candidatus Danuiimicrobium aquiferis TaxID=1801832 RepID=A0A1G1KQD9_9BACT|nr:MAG: hypothetical protein A3B72_04980 [Omnitrophica bacterium RIFCSPHIGHO2_02_FULL_45_28]OGW92384.1 MAG: hypothetical protein A3E74_08735 [Omnitrophica bacterium RIFCSPHIGHO2_12_FULL_44_12]OGW95045.1 MAG: hypothetical protein A3G33_05275 [Omnitrophica bacterium RIFCSPLOWO2_12_FULL_44_17]